jgi:hypothetical protein
MTVVTGRLFAFKNLLESHSKNNNYNSNNINNSNKQTTTVKVLLQDDVIN